MATVQDTTAGYLVESEPVVAAVAAAAEVAGPSVGPAVGSFLRLAAAAVQARHVVEIGTGTGVSGLWLLEGMAADGTLTTIDTDGEHQRLARAAFLGAGYPANRVRLIAGRPREVLPRLTDGAYDLVWCQSGRVEYPAYLAEAVRLLRPGGLAVFHDALGRATDPAARDADSVALRELRAQALEDERLLPCVVPGAEGLLVLLRTA